MVFITPSPPWVVDPTMAAIYDQYIKITSMHDATPDAILENLNQLSAHAQSLAIVGEAALPALWPMMALATTNLTPEDEDFRRFYQFIHFICRENDENVVSVDTAVKVWKALFSGGTFRPLLEHWCKFVENHRNRYIRQNTWRSVLDFAIGIEGGDNLGTFDESWWYWTSLVDEFVEHMMTSPPAEILSIDSLCEKLSRMKMSRFGSVDPLCEKFDRMEMMN